MKICTRCGTQKDLSDFSKRSCASDGLQSQCRSCHADYRRANREKLRNQLQEKRKNNREYFRELDKRHSRKKTLKKYGLTEAEYDAIVLQQDGKCLICLRVPVDKLVVDHCHTTGRVRGLLCRKCNAAIGILDDSPELLKRAIRYLENVI